VCNGHHIVAYHTVVKYCFIALLLILHPFAAIRLYIYMFVCLCLFFCYIIHDVKGFILYDIHSYAVINVALPVLLLV